MVNKQFIMSGIANLLKRNYGINPKTVDLEAYVDSKLTFGENWTIIKEMVKANSINYEFLTCKNCNYAKKIDWNFCPKCGDNLE